MGNPFPVCRGQEASDAQDLGVVLWRNLQEDRAGGREGQGAAAGECAQGEPRGGSPGPAEGPAARAPPPI